MADVKISELTALTSPDGAEELVVNDGGTTKKITITNATSASLPKAGGTMTGALFIASPNQATGGNALQIRQGNATTFGIDMGLSQTDGHLNISRVNSGTSTHMMTLARDTGNVGIGTASPSARFEVEDNGSATGGVIMKVTQDDQGSHYGMSVGNDSYSTVDTDGFVVYQMNNGHTYLYNGGVDEGPNIGMPVAGGITFGTDTAAANTLSDYEEGTFVPILRGSSSAGSFSTNTAHVGRYTKIGDVCTLNFVIAGTLSGATGSYTHFDLPFTVKAGTGATGSFSYVDTPNLNHVDFSSYVNEGQTLGYFIIKTASASTPVYPAPSSFMPNSVQIYGTVTYKVA